MNYSTLIILGIFAVSIFSISSIASAETSAKSTNFEKTTLVEFTNNDASEIQTVRMWLGKDSGEFKSFKSEKGWTGTKTPQGVLVFSTSDPLGSGESVKFGIKTEVEGPGINWKTVDSAGNELAVGKVLPSQTSTPPPPPPQDNIATPTPKMGGATFRVIPESPKTGDTVRIVGDGFPPKTVFKFTIDDQPLEDIQTDEEGHVSGTAKIPITKQADRVEFSLVDNQGNKKTISIRITQAEQVAAPQNTKKLTVDQSTSIAEPGEKVSASGTGKPGSSIKITTKDPTGVKLYEAVIPVDNQGNWSHETVVPLDAPLGTRQVEFSDGLDTITKSFSVSISKTINIHSSKTRYEPGDKFAFNGTAKPNQSLQIVITDPIGKEIFSDILDLDESGTVDFEYQTTATSLKGTYVLFATQEDETEIVRVGLGATPGPQIIAKFDKLNYASSETAKITIQGPAKDRVSILIIDPGDKVKLTESIILGFDGNKVHDLILNEYKSGVYTAVIKHPQSEISIPFAIGLQTTTGNIIIQTTKPEYVPGNSILILGSTDDNAILSLEMIDPAGNVIKKKDIFSDKEGKFSDGTFRVPSDATEGIWILKAKSGSKFSESKFTVSGTMEKPFSISVDKTTAYLKGDLMKISGLGGGKEQSVIINIVDPKNIEAAQLLGSSTKDGRFQMLWTIPTDLESGKYTIKSKVGTQTAETTFDLQ
ncbi:MAG: biofilm-associated protein [Nitrososphaerota archaeon]|nr:biofilm-associated protein [Nitrososphaerota archaeon]